MENYKTFIRSLQRIRGYYDKCPKVCLECHVGCDVNCDDSCLHYGEHKVFKDWMNHEEDVFMFKNTEYSGMNFERLSDWEVTLISTNSRKIAKNLKN